MNLKFVNFVAALGLFTLVHGSSAEIVSKGEIQFNQNSHSAKLTGIVTYQDSHEYLLAGQAGQNLKLEMVEGRNAVFQLYQQLPKSGRKALAGQNATHWKGTLSQEGTYVIAIKSMIGDSDYNLLVTLN